MELHLQKEPLQETNLHVLHQCKAGTSRMLILLLVIKQAGTLIRKKRPKSAQAKNLLFTDAEGYHERMGGVTSRSQWTSECHQDSGGREVPPSPKRGGHDG